jgi:lysozyme
VLQAENFLAVVPPAEASLPLAVDVEFTGNCVGWESVPQIQSELLAFMQHVRTHAGSTPLLYTTEEVRMELVPAELHQHSYWMRSLWGQPDDTIDWHFWQYSDTGSVPGIRGDVDLNVFAGEAAGWRLLIGASRRE